MAGIDLDMDDFGEDVNDVNNADDDTENLLPPEEETSFIDGESWEASNETPSWARDGVPSGLLQEDIADAQTRDDLVEQWRSELGIADAQPPSEFVASTRGDLWVRQGNAWLLLTHKNRPGQFLAASTLRRYGANVTKALGVHERSSLSHGAAAKIADMDRELGAAAAAIETVDVKTLDAAVNPAAEAVERLMGSLDSDRDNFSGEELPLRELRGLDRALQRIRGELINNIAKLSELDEGIARQDRKLKEAANYPELLDRIEARLRDLREERSARLEALSTNRQQLRSQVSRIRETISRMLHEDTTLAERVKTLFREQGITVVSILTAIGMAISTLVVAVTSSLGTGGATPAPTPAPADKKGLKEWVKKQLEAIKRLLGRLAGKAAAALPGVIGSVVSWILSTLGKAVGWLAQNTWAVLVGVAGLLLIAARGYISRPRQ